MMADTARAVPASGGPLSPPAERTLGHVPAVLVRALGCVPYREALQAMREFTATRDATVADEIWLVEHPAVFTLGVAGRLEHLLDPGTTIPIERVERGGQITYHGPGQVLAYTLVDLKRRGILVRQFVTLLEAAVLDTLAAYNVDGKRKPGAPGIYVMRDGVLDKIAALGIKVRNGYTFHGVALNVAMDLAPFGQINPCGYAGLRTIDLATLGIAASVATVGHQLAAALQRRLLEKDWS